MHTREALLPRGGAVLALCKGTLLAPIQSMVLYNSPTAVVLLISTLVFATGALLVAQLRFTHALTILGDDSAERGSALASAAGRLRRTALVSMGSMLGVVAFWILLGFASFHDAFDRAGPSFPSGDVIEWRQPREPALDARFDRFALPDSASARERSADRR